MNEVSEASKSEYVVLGWKTDPIKGSVIVFEKPKSRDPGADVGHALALAPSLVTVQVSEGKDVEELKREFAERYARVGIRDDKARYFEPPLLGGVRTFSVHGYVPTGKFHPIEKDKALQRTIFEVGISANPRRDVERALRLGCTKVSVGVNYEPSDHEKREQQELDRQDEEEAENERRSLQRRK